MFGSLLKITTLVAALSTLSLAAPQPQMEMLEKRATPPSLTDTGFQKAMLGVINPLRKKHGGGALKWNATLATYANKAAQKCKFAHTGGPYGENIYGVSPPQSAYYTNTKNAIMAWYNEIKTYNFSTPGPTGKNVNCLHATALLWKSTTQIGCAWSNCTTANWGYFFCELSNKRPNFGFAEDYEKNVLPAQD